MMSNYQKIKKLILMLNQHDFLKNKIVIVGGTVPYLVSQRESNREHSDIDIIVRQEDMSFVREYLKREKLSVLDSLNLSYNKLHIDYGVNAVIEDIAMNFAPYEIIGNTMLQRNFLVKQSNGIDALVTVTMKNIDINNIFSEVSLGGITIHTYSLEVIKIMKEKSKKEKDWVDIKVIDDFGYDENIYFTLKEQLKDMKFTIEPKNWLLRLFFHTLNK